MDPETQQTRGDPVSLPDIEIATAPDNGAAEFALSETGTLLFITPEVPGQRLRTLSWVDRQERKSRWRSRRAGTNTRASPRMEPAWSLRHPTRPYGFGMRRRVLQ